VTSRRVLIAAPRMPEVDRDGGSQRVDELLQFLVSAGWSATFLAMEADANPWHAHRLRQLGVATFAGFNQASAIVSRGQFDLALVAFWQPAEQLVPVIRVESPGTRIVIHSIDLHFLRDARRRLGAEGYVDARFGADLARELTTYYAADAVLTVSSKEAELLTDFLGTGRAEHLPLAELWMQENSLSRPTDRSSVPFEDRRGILFVGNFRHLPNGEAVEYLCREVLPLVDPQLLANHPLMLVGNRLDDRVRAHAAFVRYANLVGWVPSVIPYYRRARVCVAPLLHGAGVKGKVLQALMTGTPVVTTPVGAEGLDLIDDEHALIAERPGELAEALDRLLRDPVTWGRLAHAGRSLATARHGKDVVRSRFLQIVDEVMARPTVDSTLPEALVRSRLRHQAYRRTIGAVRERVQALTDRGATLLVISRGDDELLDIPDRTAWHFPRDDEGRWAGHYPADGPSAIADLEDQRRQGARYLVLPETAFWWTDHYAEFGAYLNASCELLHRGDHLVIYDLSRRPPKPVPPPASVLPPAPELSLPRVSIVGTCKGPEPPQHLTQALGTSRRYAVTQYWRQAPRRAWPDVARDDVADASRGADWVVFVDDSATIDSGFLEGFLEQAERLGSSRAQPTHTAGPSVGQPVTQRLSGCLARQVPHVTSLPVLAVRAGHDPYGAVTLMDAVTIDLAVDPAEPLDPGQSPTDAAAVDDVFVDGPGGRESAVRRSPIESAAPAISVVIATYDRPEMLADGLEGFCAQNVAASSFEVIVVDDGSPGDKTSEVLERYEARLPLCWARIDHAGRSAAKNLGVQLARGKIVLFFDDDDRPTPELLHEHLAAHNRHPAEQVAILGHTTWAPELAVTPLMHFLTDVDRLLFAYGTLHEDQELGWQGFWEGRVSCKRGLLVRHGLHDQRLDYSIDIELGWRLARHGLRVRYWPSARSYLVRPVGLEDFCERSEGKGRAHAVLAHLHRCEEILHYTRVADARERWDAARPTLGRLTARARSIASALPASWDPADPRLSELHRCYRAIFDAYRAKGASEVLRPDRPSVVSKSAGRSVPQLTVTIPVWSRTAELAEMAMRTVEQVWAVSRIPTEVIVIDNGSPEPRPFPARIHRFDANRGVATAWNTGIAMARAPVVAVVNSDCRVEPGWDEALVEAATTGRRIAFPYTDHGDGLGFRRPDQGGTAGWCFALAMQLFREIGAFDEGFNPAFCEDTDYWHRAWQLGVELSPVPAARVTHARRSTVGIDPNFDWLLQAHRYKYGWKHGVDPHRAPPYYNRTIVDYECQRGASSLRSSARSVSS
jgi:glycosyltransferase involved in cell wall biosynthesis